MVNLLNRPFIFNKPPQKLKKIRLRWWTRFCGSKSMGVWIKVYILVWYDIVYFCIYLPEISLKYTEKNKSDKCCINTCKNAPIPFVNVIFSFWFKNNPDDGQNEVNKTVNWLINNMERATTSYIGQISWILI